MISISRRTIVAAGIGLALLSGLSGAGALYLLSSNDLTLSFAQRQATLRRAYEDKIRTLQREAGLASKRQAAEQQNLEARLRDLLARQQAFEVRQTVVQTLAEQVGVGHAGLPPSGPASSVQVTSPSSAHAYAPEPGPDADDVFRLRLRRSEPARLDKTSDVKPIESDLKQAAANLDGFERHQVELLKTVVRAAEAEASQLQSALRHVGLEPEAFIGPAVESTGGPLIPAPGEQGLFNFLASQARISLDRLATLRRSVSSLPFREPVEGEIDFSSGFGYRIDPFTRSPALHGGLDFRAAFGAPVIAAGAGRVVTAEYSGAYGNMIEIDHGNAVTSRYAHLSAINVVPGEFVETGTRIGHVGSTGRSTGPHLHYETRIGGDAINPQRFLRAGVLVQPVALSVAMESTGQPHRD